MVESDFLIVGLGNPGAQYDRTRHNIGCMALEHFASAADCIPKQEKFDGRYCRCRVEGKQVVFVCPETFMNRSGQCVAGFMRFFKIPQTNIFVLHDDLDLVPGRIKVVARGGAGGHNGIRSIIDHLGCKDFARVKIGIGRPERNEKGQGVPVERYVLSRFSTAEEGEFDALFEKTDLAVKLFLTEGISPCMNRSNRS